MDQYVRIGEAAKYLGVSTKTVRNWISSGRVPGYRVGGRIIRIKKSELDRLIQGDRMPGGA